jgi:uncharacterized membrane protein YccC
MQLLYFVIALAIGVAASVFLSPVVGIIAFLVLVAASFVLLGGGASAPRTRTSTPEPTGRPRPAPSGAETSNQRQGQS